MSKYRIETVLVIIGITLTIVARDYAVARRISMGLKPSWGGEFLIIPLIFVVYSSLKADWSIDQ